MSWWWSWPGDEWESNLAKVWNKMTQGGKITMPEPVDDHHREITPRLRHPDAIGFNNLMRRVVSRFKGRKGTARGYDSCRIGGIDKVRIRRLLGLPDQAEVTMVIAAGGRRPEGLYGARVRLPYGDLIKEV